MDSREHLRNTKGDSNGDSSNRVGASVPPTARVAIQNRRVVPASIAQQAVWFLSRLNPSDQTHNLSRAVRLKGALNRSALQRALNGLVRRHEALRSTLGEIDGHAVQLVYARVETPIDDVKLDMGLAIADSQLKAIVEDLARRQFDLGEGPLFRATVVQVSDADQVLLLSMHHAIADGSSLDIITRELGMLYSALVSDTESGLPSPPEQYADYAEWQHDYLQSAALETELAFWRETLYGCPATTDIPIDGGRHPGALGRPNHEVLELSNDVSAALRELAKASGVSVFSLLLCAFNCLIARYTGQTDIVVGVPVDRRSRSQLDMLVGMFVNRIPIRTRLVGDPTFTQALALTRESARSAIAHADVPFELMVERLHPARDRERHPYFQLLFNAVPWARGEMTLSFVGLSADLWIPVLLDPDPLLDLAVYVTRVRAPFGFELWYYSDRFDTSTVRRLADDYRRLLTAAARYPERRCSELLPTEEWDEDRELRTLSPQPLATQFAPTFVPFGITEIEQSVGDRFGAAAAAHPEHIAVCTSLHTWTYADLHANTCRVAQGLTNAVGPGPDRVALLMDHDAPMVASILGLLAAGKTYVPLDKAWPEKRASEVLHDADATAILTDAANQAMADRLAFGRRVVIDFASLEEPTHRVSTYASVSSGAIAYLLYTSGSTGGPKGVFQTHRNVLAHCRAYTNARRIGPDERVALVASYTTDAAVMDLFGALLNGASLHLFDVRAIGLKALGSCLRDRNITLFHSTPTLYRHLLDADGGGDPFDCIRQVVLGGEAATRRDLERFKRCFPTGSQLVNGLGPTECTVALQCAMDHASNVRGDRLPVGRPVDDLGILLVGGNRDAVGLLARGEIAIRSPHVAVGYWRRPALTASAFVPDPMGGGNRLYMTGDLGLRRGDGRIEFLGRVDQQVKVRGHRVELGEIEAALAVQPGIRDAVVAQRTGEDGDVRLVAYVVADVDHQPSQSDLYAALRERLPEYMMPITYVFLPRLPLTESGKLDRGALPAPERGSWSAAARHVPPRTETETALTQIWSHLLGHAAVGIEDDFFALGGHSLMAMRLVARVRQILEVEITLHDVFDSPTIAALALRIIARRAATIDTDLMNEILTEIEGLADPALDAVGGKLGKLAPNR